MSTIKSRCSAQQIYFSTLYDMNRSHRWWKVLTKLGLRPQPHSPRLTAHVEDDNSTLGRKEVLDPTSGIFSGQDSPDSTAVAAGGNGLQFLINDMKVGQIGTANVFVLSGNIAELACDAIVNPANGGVLALGAGVSGAIAALDRSGTIQRECDKYVTLHGRVPHGHAMSISGGELACKQVIHVHGPCIGSPGSLQLYEHQMLIQAVEVCCVEADKLGVESLSLPSISTGVFGFLLEDAISVYAQTTMNCLTSRDKSCSVKVVMWVAHSVDTAQLLIASFQNRLDDQNVGSVCEAAIDCNSGFNLWVRISEADELQLAKPKTSQLRVDSLLVLKSADELKRVRPAAAGISPIVVGLDGRVKALMVSVFHYTPGNYVLFVHKLRTMSTKWSDIPEKYKKKQKTPCFTRKPHNLPGWIFLRFSNLRKQQKLGISL